MEAERKKYLCEKANLMRGISLTDWRIISHIINKAFEQKKGELERKIQFPQSDEIEDAIRSLFG